MCEIRGQYDTEVVREAASMVYRRNNGGSLLCLVGCVAYLGALGVAKGVAWLKEKAEESKDKS